MVSQIVSPTDILVIIIYLLLVVVIVSIITRSPKPEHIAKCFNSGGGA
jgi:hypothetical protein